MILEENIIIIFILFALCFLVLIVFGLTVIQNMPRPMESGITLSHDKNQDIDLEG